MTRGRRRVVTNPVAFVLARASARAARPSAVSAARCSRDASARFSGAAGPATGGASDPGGRELRVCPQQHGFGTLTPFAFLAPRKNYSAVIRSCSPYLPRQTRKKPRRACSRDGAPQRPPRSHREALRGSSRQRSRLQALSRPREPLRQTSPADVPVELAGESETEFRKSLAPSRAWGRSGAGPTGLDTTAAPPTLSRCCCQHWTVQPRRSYVPQVKAHRPAKRSPLTLRLVRKARI